jgi:hypothetical protein
MPNDKSVVINGSGNQLSVSDPAPHISKRNGEQVKWTSSLNVTATVTFANSPFNSSSFSVNPNGTTPSRPVKNSAPANGTDYKYSVSAPGYTTLDPNVIVDN